MIQHSDLTTKMTKLADEKIEVSNVENINNVEDIVDLTEPQSHSPQKNSQKDGDDASKQTSESVPNKVDLQKNINSVNSV